MNTLIRNVESHNELVENLKTKMKMNKVKTEGAWHGCAVYFVNQENEQIKQHAVKSNQEISALYKKAIEVLHEDKSIPLSDHKIKSLQTFVDTCKISQNYFSLIATKPSFLKLELQYVGVSAPFQIMWIYSAISLVPMNLAKLGVSPSSVLTFSLCINALGLGIAFYTAEKISEYVTNKKVSLILRAGDDLANILKISVKTPFYRRGDKLGPFHELCLDIASHRENANVL